MLSYTLSSLINLSKRYVRTVVRKVTLFLFLTLNKMFQRHTYQIMELFKLKNAQTVAHLCKEQKSFAQK